MPKNVVCKKCNNLVNGWCEKVIDSPDTDMQRDCPYFWEKTNADCIRAMSDEELAEWLALFVLATLDASGIQHDDFVDRERERVLAWLKQPAEEE